MLADIKKARLHKFLYIGAAVLLLAVAIALVVEFFLRVPQHDIAAVILAAVALIFSGLMVNQFLRAGRIEQMISERLAQTEGTASPEDAAENPEEGPPVSDEEGDRDEP
jgi:hypothetical protein